MASTITALRPCRPRIRVRDFLRRGFWAALLALHAGPVFSAWDSVQVSPDGVTADAYLRMAFLLGSATFFVLKLADVWWLRVKPGWRSTVCSLVAMGILHIGVLDRAVGTNLAYTPGHMAVILTVGGFSGAESIPKLLKAFAKRFAPAEDSPDFAHLHGLSAAFLLLRPPQWMLIGPQTGPRPPPMD